MHTETFRDFEHSGWQKVASPYHDYFSLLTVQTIAPMLEVLGVKEGTRLLDIASGPGYVAARAAQAKALVDAIDFSAVMVEKAKKLYRQINFQEADAENLPFASESYDAASMNFGLLHLNAPEKAIAESFRVLKNEGRFAFTVWCEPPASPAFGIVLSAVESFGDSKVALPPGPPFFRFSKQAESIAVMEKAGFKSVKIDQIPMIWNLDSTQAFFDAFILGTPRTGGLLRAQSAEDLEKIKNAIFESVREYEKDGKLSIPMSAILVSGTKA